MRLLLVENFTNTPPGDCEISVCCAIFQSPSGLQRNHISFRVISAMFTCMYALSTGVEYFKHYPVFVDIIRNILFVTHVSCSYISTHTLM